ncbi:hypothetical protein NADE_000373 [Nannochloris sp. 'desiccata']|nr:hypothetical protein NADE_000373 [Chlorella desiccata (nom. nud.)]
MASYLSQQRYIGFLLGTAAGAYMFISTKNLVWKTSRSVLDTLPGAAPVSPSSSQEYHHEQLFGPGTRAFMVRKWNEVSFDSLAYTKVAVLSFRQNSFLPTL